MSVTPNINWLRVEEGVNKWLRDDCKCPDNLGLMYLTPFLENSKGIWFDLVAQRAEQKTSGRFLRSPIRLTLITLKENSLEAQALDILQSRIEQALRYLSNVSIDTL